MPQTAETSTTSTETDAKTVVVSGDFTLDWNLARGRGLEAQRGVWEPEVCSRLRWQRGATSTRICALVSQYELTNFLADKLANYKRPRGFIFVDALPRTPFGKIVKTELRESSERQSRNDFQGT